MNIYYKPLSEFLICFISGKANVENDATSAKVLNIILRHTDNTLRPEKPDASFVKVSSFTNKGEAIHPALFYDGDNGKNMLLDITLGEDILVSCLTATYALPTAC